MNEQCTFKQGLFNCGSYAFNLYKEDIEQGDYCDHHYWQDQAMKAAAQEREECAKVAGDFAKKWWSIHCDTNKHMDTTRKAHDDFCALQAAIKTRGTT